MRNTTLAILMGLALASSAFAGEYIFECAGRANAKNDGYSSLKLVVSAQSATYTAFDESGKNLGTGTAARDSQFDKKHSGSNQVMMTENSRQSPFTSDVGTSLLISKAMLQGKDGRVNVTTGQPNDGDGGPAVVYDTIGFDCIGR